MSYRLPAEWEEHEATWLSWPNRRGDSFHGEVLDRVLPTFLSIVLELARSETVLLNVSDEGEVALVQDALAAAGLGGRVRFCGVPTNEPWCRDHGPGVVEDVATGGRVATCWGFNAWGQKYEPYDLDAAAALGMAVELGLEPREIPLVLEGGMVDSNGAGTALVARRSLLHPMRNPGLSEGRAAGLLREHLGITRLVWLDEEVPGDDTDGHVDVYARFVDAETVLVCHGGEAARRIREALPEVEVIEVAPPPAMEIGGVQVPAGYANFYIANRCVLLPAFGVPEDEAAARVLSQLFVGREIVPVDCRELVWGLGSIHCLTQPLPRLSKR